MKLICWILFFTILYSCKSNTTSVEIKCKRCNCYELKCSRLENPDPKCKNKYRDSCDNSEDITENDFCNIQCDCCLENQCFKWNNFSCMVFRTYEFSNIVYFILLTVNGFVLIRLFKSMFAKDEEIKMTETDEEQVALQDDECNDDRFICSYKGFFTIQQDASTMVKVPEEKALAIKIFFDNINSYQM